LDYPNLRFGRSFGKKGGCFAPKEEETFFPNPPEGVRLETGDRRGGGKGGKGLLVIN
jgi:hypothetical protein